VVAVAALHQAAIENFGNRCSPSLPSSSDGPAMSILRTGACRRPQYYLVATRRSLAAQTTFDAFDLRSLAAELNRCSAP
jgi:hypothetical protein